MDKCEFPEYVQGQVYQITCKTTGKKYIGQTKTHQWRTTQNAWVPYGYLERFSQHVRNTANFEKFGRCSALNSAMKKYGTANFEVELLEECPIECLDDIETMYIKELETLAPAGYNLETGGNKNKRASEETRVKQSESRKNFNQTEEGKALRATHGKRISKLVATTNDKKKIEKFSVRNIDRVRVVNSPEEKMIYVYIYMDGSPKRHKMRFHYETYDEQLFARVREIVKSLTDDLNKVESTDIIIQ